MFKCHGACRLEYPCSRIFEEGNNFTEKGCLLISDDGPGYSYHLVDNLEMILRHRTLIPVVMFNLALKSRLLFVCVAFYSFGPLNFVGVVVDNIWDWSTSYTF